MATVTVTPQFANGVSTIEIPSGFDPESIFLLMNGQVWAGENLQIDGGAVTVTGVDLTGEVIQLAEGISNQAATSPADDKLDLILNMLSDGGAVTVTSAGVASSNLSADVSLSVDPVLGMSKDSGRTISGLEHLYQSIKDIFMTRKGTRVMRADYGSDLMELLDKPVNETWVASVIIAVSECLEQWEPRFILSAVEVTAAGDSGRFDVALEGEFYP